MTNQNRTYKLVVASLLMAIMILLQIMQLGIIPFLTFTFPITVLHIPVIIGAIILGPRYGGFLGFVFGVISVASNTYRVLPTSFAFSPFLHPLFSTGFFASILVCFVPRILIGVFAALVFRALCRVDKTKLAATTASAIIGTLTNTVLVLTGIWFLFGDSYAAAKNLPGLAPLLPFIWTIIAANGVVEMIAAVVLAVPIAGALLRFTKTS